MALEAAWLETFVTPLVRSHRWITNTLASAALARWQALLDHSVRPRLVAVCDTNPAALVNATHAKARIAAHGPISDRDVVAALTAVMRQEAFNHKNLQAIDGRLANGMSVMAMAAHTGCNTVYGSTPPNNPHPYPWMNSLFQDGITVGWLLGESFIVDHARRSVIPERLAAALMHREQEVITPREYYELVHFSDALMTDQEILELPKVWVVGGDGGMGDIGYQNMSKVILQNRPNVKAVMLDTQVYSNTGGQNSDSTPMLGGNDMNVFGAATQGKNHEKKTVAETFLAGHGSPFVAQVSIANAPKLYRAILDGVEYRGTAFLQCFTTCQPEHGVADDMALTQAQRVRDSRGAPEFVFNPRLGESYQEALDLKGNPSTDLDWYETKFKNGSEPKVWRKEIDFDFGLDQGHVGDFEQDGARVFLDATARAQLDDPHGPLDRVQLGRGAAPVDHDLVAVALQDVDRRRDPVELARAVVAHHDRVDAVLDSEVRVLLGEDALQHQRHRRPRPDHAGRAGADRGGAAQHVARSTAGCGGWPPCRSARTAGRSCPPDRRRRARRRHTSRRARAMCVRRPARRRHSSGRAVPLSDAAGAAPSAAHRPQRPRRSRRPPDARADRRLLFPGLCPGRPDPVLPHGGHEPGRAHGILPGPERGSPLARGRRLRHALECPPHVRHRRSGG